jgi:hypothetical protein
MKSYQKWRSSIWQARKWGSYPNGHVCIGPHSSIELFIEMGNGRAEGIRIPNRRLARLLAKRINQCLDTTA